MKRQVRTIFLLSLSLVSALLMLASLPQTVHADSVVEKFPTSTNVVAAGWSNPTNAYTKDSNYANTSTDGAWQSYSGFGFNFNATDTIETVHINFARKFDYSTSSEMGFGEVLFTFYINNSLGWNAVYIDEDQLSVTLSAQAIITDQGVISAEATDYYESIDNLNNLSVSIYVAILTDSANFYLDVVSVEVVYTMSVDSGASAGPGTPEESPSSWLQLPTLSEFISGIQQDFSHISQTLVSSWNDVRYSNSFRLLLVLGVLGGFAVLVSLGRSKKQPRRKTQN